ncbi:MAG TPA: LPD7 domain-containing protein [Candidatus Sulfotelmatobacter sp.]|jgi:hypothetical protein|nr:LPD7 domain-containing protein [Candidatus Sulfotelmatobacter sp.]
MRFHGEPAPADTAAMVAAAKARGWQGLRLTGGTPEWQRAARLEALRQGFDLADISLECEDGQKPPAATAMPMPDHIRRRLGLPKPPEDEPSAPVPALPPPEPSAPGYRP